MMGLDTDMRIGVDATCWQNNRGYGRHARALLGSLVRLYPEHQYTFFMDAQGGTPVPPEAEVRLLNTSKPTVVAAAVNGRRSVSDMFRMGMALSRERLDALLYPTAYSYVPALNRAKKIVILHDVIAETYPELTLPAKSARLFWNLKVALSRYQADGLVTVSEFSRRHIIERFGIPAGRVFVVGEASDPVFRVMAEPALSSRLRAMGVDPARRIVVYVGGFSPHKNLHLLVASFARLAARKEFSDAQLVMVGENRKEVFHSYFGTISSQVDQLAIRDRVVFTGYLPDEELVPLLNLSSVLALPSLMEGFGLPAIEAAACGCPVIATKASPLPDILGEGGVFIDPGEEELETALIQVLSSEGRRQSMRQAGIAAARRLSWDAAARQMMDVIARVAAQ